MASYEASLAGDSLYLDIDTSVNRYRKPSQESSPPPSPTSHAREVHHADLSGRSQESMPSLSLSTGALSARGSSQTSNVNASRPRLPGRQETPPSPPISLFALTDADGRSPLPARAPPPLVDLFRQGHRGPRSAHHRHHDRRRRGNRDRDGSGRGGVCEGADRVHLP